MATNPVKRRPTKQLTVEAMNRAGLDWQDEWVKNYKACDPGPDRLHALNQVAPYLFAKRAPINDEGDSVAPTITVVIGDEPINTIEDQS